MEDLAVLPHPGSRSSGRRHRHAFVQRYWAFISYSHQDSERADWLVDALEKFRVPRRLVGRGTPYGLIPSRLSPVFRDRHELAAGADLRDDIREALASSRFLIVLCSPGATASRWTNEEIRLFKQLRPDGEVLAAIIAGEPWAADLPGREAEECFPPALKEEFDGEGRPTGERAEPLAADLREGRDGRQLGLLKLIAGMLDVGLDELVQRDAHRRQRRMVAITGASLLGMVAASGLAVTAIQARDTARDQRREAEGLIGFMLGDLKDRLEPIGRLDALDAVGARALRYYETQDKGALSDESLAQRSRALTLMGEIATSRGDLEGALRRYREAMAATAELMRREPDSPERIYDHAQNVFWVGDTALKRGQLPAAEQHMRLYKRLAERMVGLAPAEEKYRQERKYADTNLGVMLVEQDRAADAIGVLRSAVASSELLLEGAPDNGDYQLGLSESQAWLADALHKADNLREATEVRRRQLALLAPLTARPNSDSDLHRQQAVAHQKLGRLLALQGHTAQAVEQYRLAMRRNNALLAAEPGNAISADNAAAQRFELAEVLLATGASAEAAKLVASGCTLTDGLHRRDPTVFLWRVEYRAACLIGRARLAAEAGQAAEAVDLARRARAVGATEFNAKATPRLRAAYGRALTSEGLMLVAAGRRAEALASFRTAATVIPHGGAPMLDAGRALTLQALGDRAGSRRLTAHLQRIGYSDPWLRRDQALLAKAGLPG